MNIAFITLLLVNQVIQALNYTKIEHFSMVFLTNLAYTSKLKPMKRMKLKQGSVSLKPVK